MSAKTVAKKKDRIMRTDRTMAQAFGLGQKIFAAGETAGMTPELWNSLAQEPRLFAQLPSLIRGWVADVQAAAAEKYIIDCDADPFNPWTKDGWTVKEHQKGGQLVFDPSKVEFYLSDGQKNGKYIVGNKLRKELADKPVMNANVLDFLLANSDLIPEDWKTDGAGNARHIFFWGTVYRSRGGGLYVRFLYWDDGRWHWSGYWLGGVWDDGRPAALRAS